MKLAVYEVLPRSRGKATDTTLSPGGSWARFGNEVVVYSDETPWKGVVQRASRNNINLREHDAPVNEERLHVVVQNGRLFQQEHPDVPVLLDRGRFLLVDLEPARARKLGKKSITCYGVLPLRRNEVVFDAPEPRAARAAPVPEIQTLVNKLSRQTLEADLTRLAGFPTRFSTSTSYTTASSEVRNQLKDMGYTTRFQTITVNGKSSRNVIADKKGSATGTRKVTLVTAHLDSINIAGGPTAPAPGADDNGSGSAGVLEMARAFQTHAHKQDLRFILFGGEEEGLFGSKQYVSSLSQAERTRVRAVVNMDMIGTLNTANRKVLLEGAPLSQAVINGLKEAAETYTQLAVETSLNPFASDHVPFINKSVPAVLTIEVAGSTYSSFTSSTDTRNHNRFDIAPEIHRMNTAFVATQIT